MQSPLAFFFLFKGIPLFLLFIYLFIYFWLCCVFISVRGLSLVAASGGHSSSRYVGLSLLWPLLLRSTGSRRAGSVVVAHGPSCSTTCGIFPDQGSNPCPLHWQADSQPLRHQGSPPLAFGSSSQALSDMREDVIAGNTGSPLHTNLHVANFQRFEPTFACPITSVSSRVWRTWSRACILCKWLCFCVRHCTVLYGVR